jgi:hypothetical protein
MFITIPISILTATIFYQGFKLFTTENPDVVARNSWFFIAASIYLFSSVFLLYQFFKKSRWYKMRINK